MPMFAWLSEFRRSPRGAAAVEFALLLPLLLIMVVGMVEFGRAISQSNALERGLRAGASFAARSDIPFDATTQQSINNLVRTGGLRGDAPLLVSGWADPSATLTVDTSGSVTVGGNVVPIIRLEGSVPLDPLLPGLLAVVGLSEFNLSAVHEHAYIVN